MKHSEPLLEKVLSGLRDVEPSPGLEHRILASLKNPSLNDRAENPAQPLWHRFRSHWMTARALTLFAACAACLLTVVLLMPALHHRKLASTQPAIAPIHPEEAPTPAAASLTHQQTRTSSPQSSQSTHGTLQTADNLDLPTPRWERRALALRKTQQIQGALAPGLSPKAQRPPKPLPRPTYETLAEIETRAPSLPAPPMPLTEQETLLLRLVRARNPIELASLDRATWVAQLEKDKAQFDQFFNPPQTHQTGDQP